jgi:hypothetical protein
MQTQRIKTIAELQAEQDRLKDKMRFTRNEFHKSATRTATDSKDFLLKNILLPAGAIGLGVLIAKKLSNNGRHHAPHKTDENRYQAPTVEHEKPIANWFSKLMLVALPLVQQFFLSMKADEEASQGGTDENSENSHYASKPNNVTSWLATLVPIAIPLLQQYFVKREEAAKEHIITFDSSGDEVETEATATPKEGASAIFESLFRLLPVVLPLVQQFLASTKKPDTHAPDGRYAEAMA